MHTLGRRGDLVVVADPAPAQELAVDRVAHEGVGEHVAVAHQTPTRRQEARLLRAVEGVQLLVGAQGGGLGATPASHSCPETAAACRR